jgi:hypothetical protein
LPSPQKSAEGLTYKIIRPDTQDDSPLSAPSDSAPFDKKNDARCLAESTAGDNADEENPKKKNDPAEVASNSPVSPTKRIKGVAFSGLTCVFTFISPGPRPSIGNTCSQGAHTNASIRNNLAIGISGQVVLVGLLLAWSEKAGCLIGISPLVVGATVSASACAAPTYLASCSLSRNKGDLGGSIANALGSNVFSLLIALGLPWLLELSIRTQGRPLAAGAVDDTLFALGLLCASLVAIASSLAARKMTQTATDGKCVDFLSISIFERHSYHFPAHVSRNLRAAWLYVLYYIAALLLLIIHDYGLLNLSLSAPYYDTPIMSDPAGQIPPS